ncbi:MAG: hypothetical protein ACTHMO_06755 [Rhodanobacteraceae bacterium]
MAIERNDTLQANVQTKPSGAPGTKPKFIVCAPRYSETSGGSIALHKLAQLLGILGYEALFWPLHRVKLRALPLSSAWLRKYSYIATRLYRPRYSTIPGSILRIASKSDINDSIVIYPDIVRGNPLEARRYVRWFLYHVNINEAKKTATDGDLYFCYQEAFNHDYGGMKYGGTLHVSHWLLDIYKQTNFGDRSGACYMIRKGKSRPDLPSFRGKTVVDGMDHRSLAKVFNEKKYCYFYDAYTGYSAYAAACGCIPVIVPVPGLDRSAWEPNGGRKPGIAYGEGDIPYAIETRPLLLQRMADAESKSLDSVGHFLAVVEKHFQL